MNVPLHALAQLVAELGREVELEQRLQLLADRAAVLLGAPRVSVRLLDASGSRLLVAARAGQPLHDDAGFEFRTGEGLIGWIVEHRATLRTGDADADARFLPRADMKGPMGSFVGVPLLDATACFGVISAVSEQPNAFTAEHEELLVLLAGMCAPHLEIARLQRLSQVDPLTGALNRRGLDRMFPEVSAMQGEAIVKPLSIALADIDHFKSVNDTCGHAAGDLALRRISQLLSSVLRKGDAVVRHGGEEFLLILPGASLSSAARIAERARTIIGARPILLAGETPAARDLRITVSLGVVERRPDESRDALLARADHALYAAKQAGRDRVVTEP